MLAVYSRKERIRNHFFEYYFGHGRILGLLRLAGGPLMIFFSLKLSMIDLRNYETMSVILGALGMYTLIRPLTSMMMEWKKLKSIELKAAIKKETLFVEEDGMEIKIPLSSLRNIKKKSHYIRFNMNRFQGFSIPDRFFNSEDFRQLQQFLQKKKA
ncbi:hypothetical protein PEDI_37110 [Persicobacter diffluens]|uniref:YcxB-like C-terminal domain-containing protein n=2 Tax=Persicobacter diffluens TaxID=981 RepID=A0AAN5ALE3_9BACT|nr:hypothetical protein PEDI_37110 [Persicobacter diffluens]